MDYEMEKLNTEYTTLRALWNKLQSEWERLSDHEGLYKVYPLLTTTAAIARKYIFWNKDLDFSVKIIEPSSSMTVDTSKYFYYDEKSFFNGTKKDRPLSIIAGLFLHQNEYVYVDDREKDGKMSEKVTIFIYAKSDVLCKSCAQANNGEYKENERNYRTTKSFITYSDCTCGLYIDIESYVGAIKKIIDKKKK